MSVLKIIQHFFLPGKPASEKFCIENILFKIRPGNIPQGNPPQKSNCSNRNFPSWKIIMQYRSVASIIRPLRKFQGTQYITVRQDESLIQFFMFEVLETKFVFMKFFPHMSNFLQPKITQMN